MTDIDLTKINRRILTMVWNASRSNPENACIVYSIHINVVKAIEQISLDTIDFIAETASILIHPAMITLESWQALDKMQDDSVACMAIVANINNKFPKNGNG